MVIADIIQAIIIILTSLLACVLTMIISTLYCKTFVRTAALIYFSNLSFTASGFACVQEPPLHNVFISYSEVEYEFVKNKLLPFLEAKCNVTVCFPERDFEKGNPEIGLYEKHITKSQKVIVLLSTEYHKDSYCQYLQLECIILPMLIEKKRTKNDVLFIMYDQGARLPNVLKRDFKKNQINWQTNLSDQTKLSSLKKWLQTGNVL